MFYLVQAMEEYTDRVLPSFTKLFSDRKLAEAYARSLLADKCGFDLAEITPLTLDDPESMSQCLAWMQSSVAA